MNTTQYPSAPVRTALSRAVIILVTAMTSVLLAGIGAHAANSVDSNIPVQQSITSSSGSGIGGAFTYTLSPVSPGAPMPTINTLTLTGNEDGVFGPTVYTAPGTFDYTVTLTGSPAGLTYTPDTTQYHVTVLVTDNNGNLEAATIITNPDGTKTPAAVYSHHWGAVPTSPDAMPDTIVRNTILGNPSTPSDFTFILEAVATNQRTSATSPMPPGSTGTTKQITITGSGQAHFGTWSYTAPGTYHYTITQEPGRDPHYTYDEAVYTITDTVTEVSGILILDRAVINAAAQPVTEAVFVNTYAKDGNTSNEKDPDTGSELALPDEEKDGLGSPQTGDATNIAGMTTTLTISSIIALASLIFLITLTRRSRKDHHTQ